MTTQPAKVVDMPAPGDKVSSVRAHRRPLVILWFVLMVVGLFAADIAIKYWSFNRVAGEPVVIDTQAQLEDPRYNPIPYHEPQVVVPKILSLRLTTNRGAVFGLGKGGRPVFIGVSIIATAVVLTLFLRSSAKAWVYHAGLALVLSGALGNLYDRVVYQAVRDMFLLFPDWHLPFGLSWPNGSTELYPWIFNFADVALVVGVILLGILSWHYDKLQRNASKAQG